MAIYHLSFSALLATIVTQKITDCEAAETRKVRDLAPQWLTPERINKVPPALSHNAIQAIGENDWPELKPLLEKLRESFGPLTTEEKRLTEIDEERRRVSGSKSDSYDERERKVRKLAHEEKQLLETLTGDPRHELRAALEQALKSPVPK